MLLSSNQRVELPFYRKEANLWRSYIVSILLQPDTEETMNRHCPVFLFAFLTLPIVLPVQAERLACKATYDSVTGTPNFNAVDVGTSATPGAEQRLPRAGFARAFNAANGEFQVRTRPSPAAARRQAAKCGVACGLQGNTRL